MAKRVVLVGHCGIDGPRLQEEISSKAPDFEVTRINDLEELQSVVKEGADLLLVNREPVGFEEEGVDIIRDVHQKYPDQKMMLVSDFPEAQDEAVKAGALPGFGKADIGSAKLLDTVKGAMSGGHGREARS